MILAVDIGNSNIVFGCIDDNGVRFSDRFSTDLKRTEIEYAIQLKTALGIYGIAPEDIEGGIISSVVPQVTEPIRLAAETLIQKRVRIVGPGLKSGLNIRIDNPAQLGSDLLVDAVAGIAEHSLPLIVIDLGTATTLCVVNEKCQYIGGIVAPGIRTALNSLVNHTSLLQQISFDRPKKTIGTNTIEAMKSGTIYGNASMLDGMIDRIEAELGMTCSVVATGGHAKQVIPYCRHQIDLDENLLLKGLKIIYDKNTPSAGASDGAVNKRHS